MDQQQPKMIDCTCPSCGFVHNIPEVRMGAPTDCHACGVAFTPEGSSGTTGWKKYIESLFAFWGLGLIIPIVAAGYGVYGGFGQRSIGLGSDVTYVSEYSFEGIAAMLLGVALAIGAGGLHLLFFWPSFAAKPIRFEKIGAILLSIAGFIGTIAVLGYPFMH